MIRTDPKQEQVRNRLLFHMTPADFDRLRPHLEWTLLPKGGGMADEGAAIEHGYFMESGLGSIITRSPEGLEVEAGLFGKDGVAPSGIVMGAEVSENHIFAQIAGDAWRLPRAVLATAIEESPSLRHLLLRYVQTLFLQANFTTLSNAVHPLDERLARWLLMCDDRIDGPELALTHEFLSLMLAVRRPSVTTALHVLEGNGFIQAERGRVVIRDRRGLEEFAGDAYGRPEALFRSLIGPMM